MFLQSSALGRYQVRVPVLGLAAIAQLVEHVIRNDGVRGSSPACGTTGHSFKNERIVRPGIELLVVHSRFLDSSLASVVLRAAIAPV